jgi:hypothetical protein
MIPLLDNFINDYEDLKKLLIKHSEISFQSFIEPHLTKTFLLSCASFYESQIREIMKIFMSNNAKDERLISFAMNLGINRQYHQYFQWESNNINNFLGLFGDKFKISVSNEIKSREDLNNGMKAFLIIGNLRNKIVHNNFLEYYLPNTFDEIIEMNNQALIFLTFLHEKFK